MPTLPIRPPTSPLTPRSTPATHARDWSLFWILVAVLSVLFLELVLALSWIRYHNIRSKARWRSLRERGVVVVNGSTLIWVSDLPPRRQVSKFNLREVSGVQEDVDAQERVRARE
jgi:hypothetical protein